MLLIVYHISGDVIGSEDSNSCWGVSIRIFLTVEQLFTVSQIVCYLRASSPFRVASKASRETMREQALTFHDSLKWLACSQATSRE